MDIQGIIPVFCIADHLSRLLRITIGVLKHAQLEKLCQRTAHGTIQALVCQHQILLSEALRHRMLLIVAVRCPGIGLLSLLLVKKTADEVYAGMGHCKADPLRHIQHFHTPVHVVDDAGIGIDVALEAHLLPQETVDEGLVEGEAVGLHLQLIAFLVLLRRTLLLRRLRIVRHDGGGIGRNGSLKAGQVIGLKRALGLVNIPLSHAVMRVEAVLPGTAAGEMLDGHGHAVGCDAVLASLDDRNDPGENVLNELRILTEGAVASLPSGIGDHIGHIHIALLHAHRIPLSPDAVCEVVHQRKGIAPHCGSDAQCARPGSEDTAAVIHAEDQLAVLISGVGHHLHRHEVLALLCHRVKLVDPVRHILRCGGIPQDQMTGEPLFEKLCGTRQVLLTEDGLAVELRIVQGAGFIQLCLVPREAVRILTHAPVGNKELRDLLLGGQCLHIGLCPLLCRKAPVIIGLKAAAAVDVLEIQSVLFNHLPGHSADHRSVGILIVTKIFRCFLCHFISSLLQ